MTTKTHEASPTTRSSPAFKIMTDPYVGQLIFFRVYSGVVQSGDTIYNPVTRKKRIGRLIADARQPA